MVAFNYLGTKNATKIIPNHVPFFPFLIVKPWWGCVRLSVFVWSPKIISWTEMGAHPLMSA